MTFGDRIKFEIVTELKLKYQLFIVYKHDSLINTLLINIEK